MRLRLVSVAALSIGLVAGCAVTESNHEPLPQCFVCSQWNDANRNGRAEKGEFEGINKSVYTSREQVVFVCGIPGRPGLRMDYVLRSPKGEAVKQQSGTQLWANTCYTMRYNCRDLIAKGGPGKWKMEWFASGKRLGISEANIAP